MREIAAGFLNLVMVAYVFYRALGTFVFLPLAGGFFYGHIGLYFVLLILTSIGALVCSFFEKRFAACILSILVGLAAILFWVLVVTRNRAYLEWNYFCWSVAPELVFAVCGFANWAILPIAPTASRHEDAAD
jgi:lysylphosphatidylglycerol synthetase-like protein (DUF2156 family)